MVMPLWIVIIIAKIKSDIADVIVGVEMTTTIALTVVACLISYTFGYFIGKIMKGRDS